MGYLSGGMTTKISIDGELYVIISGLLARCFEHNKPEVIYIRLGNIYVPVYDAKLPRSSVFVKLNYSDIPANVNVVSEQTLNKLVELEEKKKQEIKRIEQEIARLSKFDVFVKEKGKLAKVVEDRKIEYETVTHPKTGKVYYVGCQGGYYSIREVDNKDLKAKAHVTKKLVYEDNSEEVLEEYIAEGCMEYYSYESEDGYGIRGHRSFIEKLETRQVIHKSEASYTMIPVSEITSKLAKEREEVEKKITEEQKKIVLEELQKKGFKIYKQGNEIIVEFLGEKSSMVINSKEELKGKYSLLAKLLLV